MPTVESEKQRRWPAVALVSAVAVAAIGAIAMSLWVQRPKGPGEILRHEFALRILSTAFGREGLRDGFRAPNKIVHRRERRLPALGGIRVTVGGYSFAAPPGAKRIRVIVVAKVHPVRVLAVAYTMPSGGAYPARIIYTQKYYTPPPGATVLSVRHRQYLVPADAKTIHISIGRLAMPAGFSVTMPIARMYFWRFVWFPAREQLWILLKGRRLYRGFSMEAWVLALAACGGRLSCRCGCLLQKGPHGCACQAGAGLCSSAAKFVSSTATGARHLRG